MKRLMMASTILALGFAASTVQAEPPAKYNMYCIACHGTGAAGAPKAGDKAAWEPRLSVGIDALVASAKKGKNAMPPMGLCNDCTDAEMKQIIEFMSK
jgi:cytochrome c5